MNEAGTNSTLSNLLMRLHLISPYDWRESAFSAEIDALLADLALSGEKSEVSEAAARAIGRIRSEAAVKVLAERQRNGEPGALRALALVRDEAPSLPKSVSRQARFYTWMSNTWRRITINPLHSVWRYLFAAVFSGIAIWWYAYSELPSAEIFSPERLGRSITTGITFGVVFGFVILFAAEIPERLYGFWPWWGRLLLNLLMGFLTGCFVWVVFDWFFLYNKPVGADFNPIIIGGIFTALAFSLGVVYRIPGWLGVLWSALMIYLSLFITWTNNIPLIYTRPETPAQPATVFGPAVAAQPAEHINQYAIIIALLIGIGAYLPMLINDARALWRRTRAPAEEKTTTSVS